MISVLFVCLANICRSPALQGTLRYLIAKKGLADKITVDSCGLGWFHVGQHPDPRAFEAAKKKGIVLDHHAQQFTESHLDEFDYIFAIDTDVAEQIKLHARNDAQKAKVFLATEFSHKHKGKPIPDPYYMGPSGFDEMMDLIVDCSEGILAFLQKKK